MKKKYNVYDENGKLVAQVEKDEDAKLPESFIGIFSYTELPWLFVGGIFLSLLGPLIVLCIGTLAIFFYLLTKERTLWQAMTASLINVAAFIILLIIICMNSQFIDDVGVFYYVMQIISCWGIWISADLSLYSILGMLKEDKKSLYEKKRKKWLIIRFLLSLAVLAAAIVVCVLI